MIRYRGSDLRTPTFCHKQGNIKRPTVITGTFWYRGLAQLVARTPGGREVIGSNPVTPTKLCNTRMRKKG